jgi:Holliday junction resolvase
MVNSRQKGARAERELAQTLREVMGWSSARRSQQFSGCVEGGAADLVIEEVPLLHVESKMVEALSIHPVMERAVKEAGSKLAVVAHKKKRTDWLLTLRLSDLPRLVEMLSSCTPAVPSDPTLPSGMTSSPPSDSSGSP